MQNLRINRVNKIVGVHKKITHVGRFRFEPDVNFLLRELLWFAEILLFTTELAFTEPPLLLDMLLSELISGNKPLVAAALAAAATIADSIEQNTTNTL